MFYSNFWLIFDHFCQFFGEKSTPVLFETRPRHPTPYFWIKKVPWVLFEIWQKHHPTLRVLLIICSIKKVLDPPPPVTNSIIGIIKFSHTFLICHSTFRSENFLPKYVFKAGEKLRESDQITHPPLSFI